MRLLFFLLQASSAFCGDRLHWTRFLIRRGGASPQSQSPQVYSFGRLGNTEAIRTGEYVVRESGGQHEVNITKGPSKTTNFMDSDATKTSKAAFSSELSRMA